MQIFTLVARSRASAVFYPGNALEVICNISDGQKVRLVFRTNYIKGYDVPVPTNFYVEASGQASNLEIASKQFHQAALEITNIIAFVANADLGQLEVELIFDSSPHIFEHEFVQTFIPNPPILSVPGRPILPDVVRDVIDLLHGHSEGKRIQIAVAQYCEMLRRWNAGYGISCLAHIYMGVEALTKAVLRNELAINSKTEDELINCWSIERKQLDNEVRRRLIFDGDVACFRLAKEISDSFEHGYGNLAEMHEPASAIVAKAASYLRAAIVRLIGASPQLSDVLLSAPYCDPRGPTNLIKKMKGVLEGSADKLAKADNPYPILVWKSKIKRVIFGKDGRYEFDPEESVTPESGDGVQLRLGGFEVWSNQLTDPTAAVLANQNVPVVPVSFEYTPAPQNARKLNWFKRLRRRIQSLSSRNR